VSSNLTLSANKNNEYFSTLNRSASPTSNDMKRGLCVMGIFYQSLASAISALALAGTAYAQVPASNDSDVAKNTGMGPGALGNGARNDGSFNTASGWYALGGNTNGMGNTASGYLALTNNTSGSFNTAAGVQALFDNTTGQGNAAFGSSALQNNFASGNTASGSGSLQSNTYGSQNTASGNSALYSNSTGDDNTASGYESLYFNTGGNYNNASGYFALHDNTTGAQNSASGVQALYGNHTGNYNTASGTDALYSNTTGSTNIAEGYKAGYNLTTGSNNIDIGNLGVAAESGTIRMGTTSTQTKTFIAGIYGTSVTGSTVVVSSTGQLGVTVSSERYKTSIAPMGSYTAKLTQLRPVTFRLKTDPKGALQAGLIAEEVANVYPELVVRDATTGRIDGVRYDELAPMLLNEMQKRNAAQDQRIAARDAEIRDLRQQQRRTQQLVAELKDLNRATQAALLPQANARQR
jgi:hypothetical protein